MDQSDFSQLVAAIFARSESGSGEMMDRYHFTNDGVLAVCGEDLGKVGFGIATRMSISTDLVESVGDLNRRMQFGHYWLSRGSDDSNWLLICGMKFHYAAVTPEYVIDLVAGVADHHGALSRTVLDYLSQYPHLPYEVDPDSPSTSAFALVGHLS